MDRLRELEEHRDKIDSEILFLRRDNTGSQTQAPMNTSKDCAKRERTAEEIIDDLFTYHPIDSEQTAMRYETVRDAAKHLALVIWKACPYGADRTAAIRKLREAVMTANAAIALKGLSI
jgi:hypothetical protein